MCNETLYKVESCNTVLDGRDERILKDLFYDVLLKCH